MSLASQLRPLADSAGSLRRRLFEPIDPSSLVFFRFAWGVLIFWEMVRYLDHQWVQRHYQLPDLLFKYWLFEWVHPLPGIWLAMVFMGVGLAALFVAIGSFYRVNATIVFLGLTYIFFLDKARYLNHWYLMVLIALLMVFIPAGKSYALDRIPKGGLIGEPTVPAWSVWILRFQLGVVYFFGGIAKINGDWLRGEPIADWLAARSDFPFIGGWFEFRAVGVGLGYAAMVFDVLVLFLLLNRRTRPYAFLGAIVFHLMNDTLFRIGVFPWLAISATTIFFDPDWPKQVWADLTARSARGMAFVAGASAGLMIGALFPSSFVLVKMLVMGVACGLCAHQILPETEPRSVAEPLTSVAAGSKLAITVLAAWVAIQVLVPLRHFVVPGNVHWTEEGHRYSWHMKLRDKDGTANFIVVDQETGESVTIDPDEYLSERHADRVTAIPDIAVQFAYFLEDTFRAGSDRDYAVYADGLVSLNGREPQRLFDPTADLTEVSLPSFGADWLLPLDD